MSCLTMSTALATILILIWSGTTFAQHHDHALKDSGAWPPVNIPPLESLPNFTQTQGTSITIESESQLAQKYFDYGLAALHGFAYLEAYRAFDRALSLDSDLAMGHWGKAYSMLGVGKTGERLDKIIKSATKDLEKLSDLEREYIKALVAYTRGDEDYIKALESLIERYPNELEAKLLLAFFMNDGYDKFGVPRGRQAYAKSILRPLLEKYPQHIGTHHYWIHATEGSKYPDRARASAHILEQDNSNFGHIVHMPGHIAWLSQDFQTAVKHFRAAEETDTGYMQKVGVGAVDYWPYLHY